MLGSRLGSASWARFEKSLRRFKRQGYLSTKIPTGCVSQDRYCTEIQVRTVGDPAHRDSRIAVLLLSTAVEKLLKELVFGLSSIQTGRVGPNFARRWPNLGRTWQTIGKCRPNLADASQIRPKVAGSDLTKLGRC